MDLQAQIDSYIAEQPQPKREELQTLHRLILAASPNGRLWFLDGRNEEGKVVSNPTIGYGIQEREYANRKTKAFFQIGLSANTTGLSIYVMGLDDKQYLSETYGHMIGKAKITGYCVKFRSLGNVNLGVISQMVANHLGKGADGSKAVIGDGPASGRSL
jgi:hypothetical protein